MDPAVWLKYLKESLTNVSFDLLFYQRGMKNVFLAEIT